MGLAPEQSTRLRAIETSYLTPVFIKGDVQHIMLLILHTPMLSVLREDGLRPRLVFGLTRDTADRFDGREALLEMRHFPLNAEDLLDMRKVDIGIQGVIAPDPAGRDLPMAFLGGGIIAPACSQR